MFSSPVSPLIAFLRCRSGIFMSGDYQDQSNRQVSIWSFSFVSTAKRLKEAAANPCLGTEHLFFFSAVFSGPDGMFWPRGRFRRRVSRFHASKFAAFARLFARCWGIPAEIESWRYLFSCMYVYLSISSNLDQHSCIYRNSLGGVTPGSCTVSHCWPVQLHWSSQRWNFGSRTTALEISTLYPSVWASPPSSPQGYRCSLNTGELRERTVHKCIQREELFQVKISC